MSKSSPLSAHQLPVLNYFSATTYGTLLLFGVLFLRGILGPVSANAETDKTSSQTAHMEKKLSEIIIPSIKFQDMPLNEVLAYLQRRSVELDVDENDPTKKGVNFILNVGESVNVKSLRITLKLSDAPLITAVRYTAGLSQLAYKVEPHAVVFVPLDKTAQPTGKMAKVSAPKDQSDRADFVPSPDHVKKISSDEFHESGHRIGNNPAQIRISIKPDSTVDAAHYAMQSGPTKYLQVTNKNKAMKPRMIMGTGIVSQSNSLRSIFLKFPSIQDRDDFVAELNLNVSASSGSRNTPTFKNTTKINSYDIKKEGHRIHDDQILDIQIKRSSSLTKDSIKTPQQGRPRWIEVTHANEPMKPRRIFGYGHDDANNLRSVMIKFPTMRELDDFGMRLDIKIKRPLHIKDTSPSPQNTVKISSDDFHIDGHRIQDDRILDIKIKPDTGLDLNLQAMKNMRRWVEVMHENEVMAPLRLSGHSYKGDTTELQSIMIEFPTEKELGDFVDQLGLKLRVK